MNKGQLTISYHFLRRFALIYISLPLFCFFIGWLKWYFAVLSCLALIVCLLFSEENSLVKRLFHKDTGETETPKPQDKKILISKALLISVVIFTFVYCILCGVGRLWAQSVDHPWRNAIFRDLITKDWPVLYDNFNGALSYYIGLWLPAAIPGKLVYLLSKNSEAAFLAGNIVFLIYFALGMCLLFLLLIMHFNVSSPKQVFLVLLGFVFFSGMDILSPWPITWHLHLEWWAGLYQFSSITTCVCWVFNQALISWISMALLLHEDKVSNYAFIGMACLFNGPFPFVGYFVFCVAKALKRLFDMLKAKKAKSYLREVFSISNICSALFVFPFIGSYLLSNNAIGSTSTENDLLEVLNWRFPAFFVYVIFVLIEFGVFAVLIAKANCRNYLFYVAVLLLLVCPMLRLGSNADFTMRASIPPIFMMYVFCYRFILDEIEKRKEESKAPPQSSKGSKQISLSRFLCLILIGCLVIGAVTPCVELARGFEQVYLRGINDPETDSIITLERDKDPFDENQEWPPVNFIATDMDNKVFFKYFARL